MHVNRVSAAKTNRDLHGIAAGCLKRANAVRDFVDILSIWDRTSDELCRRALHGRAYFCAVIAWLRRRNKSYEIRGCDFNAKSSSAAARPLRAVSIEKRFFINMQIWEGHLFARYVGSAESFRCAKDNWKESGVTGYICGMINEKDITLVHRSY